MIYICVRLIHTSYTSVITYWGLTYGTGTVSLYARSRSAFYWKGCMLGVSRTDRIKKEVIRQKNKVIDIAYRASKLKCKQHRADHISDSTDNCWGTTVLERKPRLEKCSVRPGEVMTCARWLAVTGFEKPKIDQGSLLCLSVWSNLFPTVDCHRMMIISRLKQILLHIAYNNIDQVSSTVWFCTTYQSTLEFGHPYKM